MCWHSVESATAEGHYKGAVWEGFAKLAWWCAGTVWRALQQQGITRELIGRGFAGLMMCWHSVEGATAEGHYKGADWERVCWLDDVLAQCGGRYSSRVLQGSWLGEGLLAWWCAGTVWRALQQQGITWELIGRGFAGLMMCWHSVEGATAAGYYGSQLSDVDSCSLSASCTQLTLHWQAEITPLHL